MSSAQPFRPFTYVTTHFPTLPSLYLRHSSYSNPPFASPMPQFSYTTSSSQSSFSKLSVTSTTSQLILQPFRRFTYVKAHSPTLPLFHLRHSSFSNTSFASSTSQALLLIHLASRPYNFPILIYCISIKLKSDFYYQNNRNFTHCPP